MKHLPVILFCLLVLFFIKKRFFDTTNYKQLLEDGGVIIDVRSQGEFFSGNIENSINIPLADLQNGMDKFQDKDQPIITCCASGVRSAAAKQLLKVKGYTNVVNGGGWSSLNRKIK